MDEGEEEAEDDDGDDGGNGEMVYHDGIDSSKTIDEVVKDTIKRAPAENLADIYADDDGDDGDGLFSESDSESRGAETNLDTYIGPEFSTYDSTLGWVEWDSK